MNNEERHIYEGLGALTPEQLGEKRTPTRAVFFDVEAVFPTLDEAPALNRVDFEIVDASCGWRSFDGYQALRGWEKRVHEACVGYDRAYIFALHHQRARAETLRKVAGRYLAGGRAFQWQVRTWGYGEESDYFVAAFGDCLTELRRERCDIREVTIYLNRNVHFIDAVRAGLAQRHENISLDIRAVHSTLGLFALRLPLPDEFEEVGEWLENYVWPNLIVEQIKQSERGIDNGDQ